MSNAEVLAALKQRAAAIDAVMEEDLASVRSPLLKKVIRHALFQGGKRIRPLLTVLAASLRGTPPDDTARLAISFEYLHAASLIHDDIIDHSELRRGQRTANILWGDGPAILAGDFLHARAMGLASEIGGRQGMEVIGRATAAMVEAEFLQMQNALEKSLTEENYFQVLMGKTAALIAAACEAGISHGLGSQEECRALRNYGTNLGLAFQIVDDLLDYLGDPAKTGKAVGNDFQEGKMTLPLIHALAAAAPEDRDVLAALLHVSREERNRQLPQAKAIMEKSGSFLYAGEKAKNLIGEAVEGLAIFPDSQAKLTLISLAHYVLTREK
ncbi:polyprenyl synthetase family protein [Thiovibrio sp. JS02]